MSFKKIEIRDWHIILDELEMGPESTHADVIAKISVLQQVHKETRRKLYYSEKPINKKEN